MGNIRLYGSTSGYTELAPPAVAPDGVLSLPSGVGTLLTAEGGKVLQVVRATDSTLRSTTSTSFTDASLSVTITPQKSDSAILLIHHCVTNGPATNLSQLQLTDASNNAISGAQNNRWLLQYFTNMMLGWDTPATTSAVTYKVRFRVESAGTLELNNDANTGQLYAIEVSA
jgi:hypothetical protein